jgi:hypothetical protein
MLLDNGVGEVTIASTSPYLIPSAFIMYMSPSMVDERLCRRTVSWVDGACGDVGDCLRGDQGGGRRRVVVATNNSMHSSSFPSFVVFVAFVIALIVPSCSLSEVDGDRDGGRNIPTIFPPGGDVPAPPVVVVILPCSAALCVRCSQLPAPR